MREIKFRAWDGERLKEVISIGWIDGEVDYISTPKISAPADNFVLMQFTGLKDKNGKEIYEGDVVRVCPEDDHDPLTGELKEYHDYGWKQMVVEWKAEYAGYGFDGEEFFSMEYRYSLCAEDFVTEVIGNIYENPELLSNVESAPKPITKESSSSN